MSKNFGILIGYKDLIFTINHRVLKLSGEMMVIASAEVIDGRVIEPFARPPEGLMSAYEDNAPTFPTVQRAVDFLKTTPYIERQRSEILARQIEHMISQLIVDSDMKVLVGDRFIGSVTYTVTSVDSTTVTLSPPDGLPLEYSLEKIWREKAKAIKRAMVWNFHIYHSIPTVEQGIALCPSGFDMR